MRNKSEEIEKSGKKVKVVKKVKEPIEGTVIKLLENFNQTLMKLKKRIYNIKMQYKSYQAKIVSHTSLPN